MKNHGEHGVDNWELEWIGFLPGKRESRRYIGKYIVDQNDVESEGRFNDMVAYAGWTMDDHFPEGFYYTKGHPTIYHPAPQPWGLPLRCMISKNIENLTFAGRNISVTHAALSSTRVMATCSILGQALGTAVAKAVHEDLPIEEINVHELQKTLMDDDCYIPWHKREISALSAKSECSSKVVKDGIDRGDDHLWIGHAGDTLEYTFPAPTDVKKIRLVFDSHLNRDYQNMPCNFPLKEKRFFLPHTLIKEYRIEGYDESGLVETMTVQDNHHRFVMHDMDWNVTKIKFIPLSTHGDEAFRVFDFEVIG